MPIIFLGNVPSNASRFVSFVFLSVALILVIPFGGGAIVAQWLGPALGYMWGALSCIILVYSVARIDHKACQRLKWQIDQYSKPIWENIDDPPAANTMFDKIAAYITED